MAASDHLSPGQFYHGTRRPLKPGQLITPGRRANHSASSPRHVYFTENASQAGQWADLAKGRGGTRVFQVEPTGDYYKDHESHLKGSWRSKSPLRVVGELDTWDSGRD